MKSKGLVTPPTEEEVPEAATTNVVDFMDLLRKSIASNKRTAATGAKRSASKKAAKTRTKAPAKKPRRRRKSA
jgi:DNA end-binding protein Ku